MRRYPVPAALLAAIFLAAAASAAVDRFTVLHFSDVHIGPHLAREAPPGAVRGADTIAWMSREVAQPQNVPGFDAALPPPDFAVVTGDITEYGVIDNTWSVVERAFADLPCPWYAVPGNHDNTWVAMYDVLRKRHGGANHAYDHQGWHFAFISSASPQEPVPSLDATTRSWLKQDLARLKPATPIVLALHHSPEIGEYANPAEMDTFIDLIRDYNVQLLLVGHGHSPRRHDVAGLPAVEGGSTFGKNSGYGLLILGNGRIHYAYRQLPEGAKEDANAQGNWRKLHEAPVVPRRRLFDIAAPEPDSVVRGDEFTVRVAPLEPPAGQASELTFAVDGRAVATLRDVDLAEVPVVPVPVRELAEGAHLLTVSLTLAGEDDPAIDRRDLRTRIFHVDRGKSEVLWRRSLPAAVKAGPVIAGDLLIIAGTDGAVVALDRRSGDPRWRMTTGGEILASPAWSGELLVFGSGDGSVYAVDAAGATRWRQEVGMPVYGQPRIADGVVYVGDNGGRMHALDLKSGKPAWTFARADYAIECQPALWNDALCFGAWDGFLYCLNRADGTLRWKQLGPKSSTHPAARYYAPADCGPLVLGDRLMVCDRGYHLGAFKPDGTLDTNGAENASAIAPGERDAFIYSRHVDHRIRKLDRDGRLVWESPVPAGRFPIPPTVMADRVYVCANTGMLSMLDAKSGATIWTYQATAGFYVMSPVTTSDDGVCYVAGMDGTLVAVRPKSPAGG